MGRPVARSKFLYGAGHAFEKARNGNAQVLSKVGVDLGFAPCRLGVGAAAPRSTQPCARSTIEAPARAKMTRKARIGVIGAGWWAAANHLPVLKANDDCEIVALNRLGATEL